MARISINIRQVEATNQELQRTLRELSEIEGDLMSIRRGLPMDVRRRCGINDQLNQLSREIGSIRRQFQQLLTVTRAGVDAYRTAEYRLSHRIPNER